MIALGLALLAVLLHGATAERYGYFRDELYFIACSKHLAWGYVDQPPLVAVAAWLAAPAHYQLVALRALPILAAALTVAMAVRLSRELGGGPFAQLLAGVATLLMPAYLLLGNTLTTSSFEPLCWTLLVYVSVRIVRADSSRVSRWWIAAALVAVLGLYAKYSMLLPIVGLTIALLTTPERRVLRSVYAVCAVLLAPALLSPNLAWQAAHGWPIFEVLHGDVAHRPTLQAGFALEYGDAVRNAGVFLAEQFVYTNPLAAPIWIGGLIVPFRMQRLRDLRYVGIAYFVLVGVMLLVAAKGYYIVGFYGALFAIGAVGIERLRSFERATLFGVLTIAGLLAMPLSLPVLPVDGLIAYSRALHLTGNAGTAPHLMQPVFAEEFGWRRLAADVAAVYSSLPASVRAGTAIYADTYADAAALDFFGSPYGLPPAISSQNNYYLWRTRGYSGATLIAIGATRIGLLRQYYRSVVLVRTSTEPYKWIVEGPAPIFLCRDPVAPLDVIWPHLRWYGA